MNKFLDFYCVYCDIEFKVEEEAILGDGYASKMLQQGHAHPDDYP